jgi:hypothetical protein
VVLTPARADIVDRSPGNLSRGRRARPRAPDLTVTVDDATFAIRLAA